MLVTSREEADIEEILQTFPKLRLENRRLEVTIEPVELAIDISIVGYVYKISKFAKFLLND